MKLKFGIRSLLVVTMLCAAVVALLYPFEPRVEFSPPVFVEISENQHGVKFKHFEMEIRNDSFLPVWCGSDDGETINSYCCYPPNRQFSGAYQNMLGAKGSWVPIFRWRPRTVNFHTPYNWDGVRIEMDASDWRDDSNRYRSADFPIENK